MNDEPLAIEVLKNAATNGRLFCLMLFVIWIAVYCRTGNAGALAMAVWVAVPVGLATLSDRTPGGSRLLSIASVAISAGSAIATLVVCLFFG